MVPQEAWGPLIEERTRAGYTACVQDEAICVADARLRKGVYTPKGGPRRLHVHGIALQDGTSFLVIWLTWADRI